jgi:hypothetical protein
MLFSSPVQFQEALDSLRARALLPTSASSAQLAELPAQIRSRSIFSARTINAGYLQEMKNLTDQLLQGGRYTPVGDYIPGSYMEPATMRLKLKEALKSISYDPAQIGAEFGTLKDLGSDPRLNLIIQMQSDSAWGFGKFIRDQDPAALEAAPAQELFRAEARREPRNWPARWMDAGGEFYGSGRMIALKNDPIWSDISAFGQPYPPFDYGSGMWVRDILRPEALALGVIDPDQTVQPSNIQPFNDGFQSSIDGLDSDLQAAVVDSMGDIATFVDGILHLKNNAA